MPTPKRGDSLSCSNILPRKCGGRDRVVWGKLHEKGITYMLWTLASHFQSSFKTEDSVGHTLIKKKTLKQDDLKY